MAEYFDDSNYDGDYEDSVLSFIEGAITWWEERDDFACFDEPLYEQVKDWCTALVAAISEPNEADSILGLFRELNRAFQQSDEYSGPEFNQMIEFELAKKTVGMIADAAPNTFSLFGILCQIQDNDFSRIPMDYLKRVLRCYVWGLYPESVILCRSVIETALNDKLSDKFWTKYCNYGEGYTLKNKINAVERSRLISGDMIQILHKIRCRGNKCVHGDMEAVKDIKGTIADTCKALIRISEMQP